MLKSLPKDDILFVYGDNDTYPVWAIQETENFRDDVKVVNFTLLSTPWNIDQVKRKTYNANAIPSTLTHEDYREGSNDQIVVFDTKTLGNIINNYTERGYPEAVFAPFKKYLTQDSMTVKEALDFIKLKSPEKDEMIKILFGEERYEKFNFIPVSKFTIPVNKANAIKYGVVKPSDASKMEDHITVNYAGGTMFKNNLMLLDILANFDWKRNINFSSGGVYDSENLFYLDDYLQYDGFSYRLTPIKTPIRTDGEMGRVDGDDLFKIVKNFRWGNFKDLNNHFDETATSNIMSYRNSAGRAAEALSLAGKKQKAVEILDLVSKEIPVSKYNDPRSLSSIVYAYIVSGQEQKGLKLAAELKKGIFEEYDYYSSLSAMDQKYAGRQMRAKPMEYSLVVAAVTDAYKKIGQKDKGYAYLVNDLKVIDKRFNSFIQNLNQMGKEKAFKESEKVQIITPFYTYLFDVMKPYDSTYENEKTEQITKAIMDATK
jgi:hypothetical protein